jgi:uncharacterized membrane protein
MAGGWHDFKRAWPISLAYGVVLGALGMAVLYAIAEQPYLAMAVTTGYLFLGPALAVGLYQVSRRMEWQESGRIGNQPQIGQLFSPHSALFALVLVLAFALWVNLAMMGTTLFSAPELMVEGAFSPLALFSMAGLTYLLAFVGLAALVAAVVFGLGAITLPMLLDRHTDLATAMMTSWLVVKENPAVMASWAATILVLTLIGMASLFIGFAILFPVLGHATWHAYRELVERG